MNEKQSKGGIARAANMTDEERSESARKAALARWGKDVPATVFAIRSTVNDDPVWWSDAWNSWESDLSKSARYPYHAAIKRLAALHEQEGMIAIRTRVIGLRKKNKP